MTVCEEIERQLRAALQPQHLVVEDQAQLHIGHSHAGEGHFRVVVVADIFFGVGRIARHRMVYDILQRLMQSGIHALAIHAFTPAEYANNSSFTNGHVKYEQ